MEMFRQDWDENIAPPQLLHYDLLPIKGGLDVFVSEKDWKNQESAFLANAREEAVAA
jgi:hypothetical protein